MNLRHLPLALAFAASPAFACISFPKTVELQNASFTSSTNLSIQGNCGSMISLTLKSEDQASSERYHARSDAFMKWRDTNPEPKDWSSPAYEAWSKRQKNMDEELEKKFPELKPSLQVIVIANEGKVCMYVGTDQKCDVTTNKILNDEHGKAIGVLDLNPRRAVIYSVNEKGVKDPEKPALVIKSVKRGTMEISSMDKRQVAGFMSVNGEVCTKSIGSQGEGTVGLLGKSISTGGGCGGGSLDAKEFKASDTKGSSAETASDALK